MGKIQCPSLRSLESIGGDGQQVSSHTILLSHKSLSLTFYYGRSTSLEKMAAGYFIIWIKIFCLRVFALISYMRAGNIFSLSTPPLSVLYHVILK
jgi:hypothetical protein